MNHLSFCKFVRVLASNVSCLKHVNMRQMMIRFYGFKFGECERSSKWFVKNNYLNEKIKKKEAKVGKGFK